MGEIATINISRAVADAAAERAKQQGLTTEDYLSELVFRDLERQPAERNIIAYDDRGVSRNSSWIARRERLTRATKLARPILTGFSRR